MASISSMSRFVSIENIDSYLFKRVNLVGVVVEFSFFRRTLGTDYFCVLKIVQKCADTQQQSEELSVYMFAEHINELPRIKFHGDIIVLRKVLIKLHKSELSAVFNKTNSEFGLFDVQNSQVTNYQSYGSFYLNWNETQSVVALKAWWQHYKKNSERPGYRLPMRCFSMGSGFDLLCKVLHVCHDTTKGVWIIYVWDGTDAPPLSLNGDLTVEQFNCVPLQIESTPLECNIISRFERLGTVLRVTTKYGKEYFGSHFPGLGKWVIFSDMHCKVLVGMWYGKLKASSRVRLLAGDDNIVERCVSDYRRRELEYGRLPLFAFPNRFTGDHGNGPFSTLMDVVSSEQDNHEFCCVVRVLAISPMQHGEYSSDVQTFKLTLEDATTRILAIVRPQDLADFVDYNGSSDLMETVKRLLGVPTHLNFNEKNTTTRFPPWLECSIIKQGNGGRRRYFVC